MNCVVENIIFSTRVATPEDLDSIMELLILMGTENAAFKPNVEKSRRIISDCIGNTLAFVLEKHGEIVGCCALNKGAVWYSDDETLSDYAFYIHPDHRSFDAALAFINLCKRVSAVLGIPLMLGIHSNVDPLRKMKLFSRTMTLMGGYFLYTPEAK